VGPESVECGLADVVAGGRAVADAEAELPVAVRPRAAGDDHHARVGAAASQGKECPGRSPRAEQNDLEDTLGFGEVGASGGLGPFST